MLDTVVLYRQNLNANSLKKILSYLDRWEHFHSISLQTDRFVLRNHSVCIQSYRSNWLCLQLILRKLTLFHW